METTTANQPVTISTGAPPQPASDFRFLRSKGIEWIQKLAGNTWTDHNTHDPGITILDLLCYAITDLSHRLDYDIKDLLATGTGNAYDSLYSPLQVLTTNPVTLSDWRKIVLDVEGVKNAWIEKQTGLNSNLYYYPGENIFSYVNSPDSKAQVSVLKGIYRALVDKESEPSVNAITKRLHSRRNLCEDFLPVRLLATQSISVSGFVEIGQATDVNTLAAGILFRIHRFLSPQLTFYTLPDMLAKGKRTDEIFEGPALLHGFIDDDELAHLTRRTELHTSDIIREMMDEPGVLYVNSISLQSGDAENEDWVLPLAEDALPLLDPVTSLSSICFKKNGATISVQTDTVINQFNKLKDAQTYPILPVKDRDVITAEGDFYSLADYYSLQHHFPQVYGLGEAGLPESASPERKALAKQLKAYLLFFEQILADYYSQAAHLKDLFSFSNTGRTTYFSQSLQGLVPGVEEILNGSGDTNSQEYIEQNAALLRKNRFLDHLIARFGENLSEYSLHQSSQPAQSNSRQDLLPAVSKEKADTTFFSEKLISDKLRFLAAYPQISNDRGKARDYTEYNEDDDNISGLEKRIAAQLGIDLSGEERFYMLEHILLRPVPEDASVVALFSATTEITGFADGGNGSLICYSRGHGLLTGETIIISESNFYNNDYTVTQTDTGSFRVSATYQASPGQENNKGFWQRRVNTIAMTFLPCDITEFLEATDGTSALCKSAGHGLAAGNLIRIQGTRSYDGMATVTELIDDETFRINKPFVKTDARDATDKGTWTRTRVQPDIYSLQLTFFFPKNAGRFSGSDFRTFTENTVRKETPVHLTVYMQWLDDDKIKAFKESYDLFWQETAAPAGSNQRLRWRALRNRLISWLPFHLAAYPLADMLPSLPGTTDTHMVSYDQPATITLTYGQRGVVYKVLRINTPGSDTKDILMNENKAGDEGKDKPLSITTVPLQEDNYTFRIQATDTATGLSTDLFQAIAVKIGVNQMLAVSAENAVIDYGTPATIIIEKAQSGTLYQLIDENKAAISDIATKGTADNLSITTTPLQNDVNITVTAKSVASEPDTVGQPLKSIALIQVYPSKDLHPSIEPAAVDYKGNATVVLSTSQPGVFYQLQFENMDDDDMANKNAQQNVVYSPVSGTGKNITLPVTNLTEDLTLNIIATKSNSGLQQVIPGLVVPVKPKVPNVVSTAGTTVKAGETVTIEISGTQPGVMYQLRRKDGDTFVNVGNPVYHSKNYGIGKARVEIEFIIGTFTGDPFVLLTDAIHETTTFDVLATKITTQQQANPVSITFTVT